MAASKLKTRHFAFRLRPVGKRAMTGAKVPARLSDADTFAVEVSRAAKAQPDLTFAATPNGADGTFRYHVIPPNPYPKTGDVHLQLWEADRFEPFEKKSWAGKNQYKYTAHWYTQEEADHANRDGENELLGSLTGFIALIKRAKRKAAWAFICTEDAGLPAPKPGEPSITLAYQKLEKGTLKAVTREVALKGEFESIYEIGLYAAASAKEAKWKNEPFRYPLVFIECFKNLVRRQLEEGGLTVAFYAALNSDDDDRAEKIYRRSTSALAKHNGLRYQLKQRARQVLTQLVGLRTKLCSKAQQPREPALWKAVEEEVWWRHAQMDYLIKTGVPHKRKSGWVAACRSIVVSETERQTLRKHFGKAETPYAWKEKVAKRVPKLYAALQARLKTEAPLPADAMLIAQKGRRGRYWTLVHKGTVLVRLTLKKSRLYAARRVPDVREHAWRKRYRKAKPPQRPNIALSPIKPGSYNTWRAAVTKGLEAWAKPGSSGDLLTFMKAHYGVPKAPGGDAKQANLCAGISFEAVVIPEEVKQPPPSSTKRIKDISNDREFHRNAPLLAHEFGFLTHIKRIRFEEDAATTDTPKATVTYGLRRGAYAVDRPQDMLPRLDAVCRAVEACYPDLVKTVLKGKPVRVHRLVLFTHGTVSWGLKFPVQLNTSKRAAQRWWLTRRMLDEPAWQVWTQQVAGHLADEAIVTLYACSTGGNSLIKLKELNRRSRALIGQAQREARKRWKETELTDKDKAKVEAQVRRVKRKRRRKARRQKLEALFQKSASYQGYRVQREAVRREVKVLREGPYRRRLLSYGGNPASPKHFRNTMGTGSFAERLCGLLSAGGKRVTMWAHTDPGHTSRNARLRVFVGSGKTREAHDLVRLVFGSTAAFKANADEPTKQQLRWWWIRGDIEKPSIPHTHPHAIKKAALCRYSSLNDAGGPFSLKRAVDELRAAYGG